MRVTYAAMPEAPHASAHQPIMDTTSLPSHPNLTCVVREWRSGLDDTHTCAERRSLRPRLWFDPDKLHTWFRDVVTSANACGLDRASRAAVRQ